MKDDDKKLNSAIGKRFRIFSSRLCQSLNDVKEKPQLELCTLTGWGTGGFSKNLRISLFNKYISNEPIFGRIHLAGQYL
jgi:hypothetical protein